MQIGNRREEFLAEIAGKGSAPKPKTRVEILLKKIASRIDALEKGGGGGGGGSGGGLVKIDIDQSGGGTALKKTAQEILNYINAGMLPYVDFNPTGGEMPGANTISILAAFDIVPGETGSIGIAFGAGSFTFMADSLSDYPVLT